MKPFFLWIGIASFISSCDPGVDDEKKDTEVVYSVDNHQRVYNRTDTTTGFAAFTIDTQALRYHTENQNTTYRKNKDVLQVSFSSEDAVQALAFVIEDFNAVKEGAVIPLVFRGDSSISMIYFPDRKKIMDLVGYSSYSGKIKITALDRDNRIISGTFEAKDFEDPRTRKKVTSPGSIKGTFTKVKFKVQ